MPRRTARRTRSPHPGVVVTGRDLKGGTSWRAKYRDPETNRWTWETLDGSLTTPEARAAWAVLKSASLGKRRAEIASGAPLDTRVPVADAVTGYFKAGENRLRPATVACYRVSVGKFQTWTETRGIANTGQIMPATLAQFREALISRKKTVAKAGKRVGRGARAESDRRVSPASINHDLRAVAAFLNNVRKLGRAPFLSRDTIAESLARLPMERPTPEPLSVAECGALLAAAVKHDAMRWALTRAEHAADSMAKALNRTPRFPPVAPLVAFVLLTGCRIGEALNLAWSDVDLDALDHDRNPVGQIRLKATATKTHTERRVDLAVSPRLRAILSALKLRAGGAPYVFGGDGPMSDDDARNAAHRLARFGAPRFSWQRLRQTCGTFLTNAGGIFGASSAYRSAKQLGHSVTVAERFYVDVIRGIPRDARTLDTAMNVDDVLAEIASRASGAASVAASADVVPVAPTRIAV